MMHWMGSWLALKLSPQHLCSSAHLTQLLAQVLLYSLRHLFQQSLSFLQRSLHLLMAVMQFLSPQQVCASIRQYCCMHCQGFWQAWILIAETINTQANRNRIPFIRQDMLYNLTDSQQNQWQRFHQQNISHHRHITPIIFIIHGCTTMTPAILFCPRRMNMCILHCSDTPLCYYNCSDMSVKLQSTRHDTPEASPHTPPLIINAPIIFSGSPKMALTQRIQLKRPAVHGEDFYIKETERYCVGQHLQIPIQMNYISQGSSAEQERYSNNSLYCETVTQNNQGAEAITRILEEHSILDAFDCFENLRSHLMDILESSQHIEEATVSFDTLELIEDLKCKMRVYSEKQNIKWASLDEEDKMLKETLLSLAEQRMNNEHLKQRIEFLNQQLSAYGHGPLSSADKLSSGGSAIANSSNRSGSAAISGSSSIRIPTYRYGKPTDIKPFTLVAEVETQSTVDNYEPVQNAGSVSSFEVNSWAEITAKAFELHKSLLRRHVQAVNCLVMHDDFSLSKLQNVCNQYRSFRSSGQSEAGEQLYQAQAMRFMEFIGMLSEQVQQLMPAEFGVNACQ